MNPELPQVSQTVIDEVFGILIKMEVELDDNPLEYGPRRLNLKTSETRKRLAECEHLFLRVSGWLQKCRAAHRAAETNLELGKKHLLSNDPEVRSGRNVADRDALASMKLRAEVEELSKIRTVSEDLEAMLGVIKSKRIDLRDVQNRIRDQMRLCQEEIGLGGRWGSKIKGQGPEAEIKDPDHKSLKDLREMFSGVLPASASVEVVSELQIAKSLEPVLPVAEAIETDLLDEEGEPDEVVAVVEQILETPPAERHADLVGDVATDADADDFLNTLTASTEASKKKEQSIDDLLSDFDLDS